MPNSSVFSHRSRVFQHIGKGDLGSSILADLLPNGIGLPYEKALWDYKAELPTLPSDRRPSENEKQVYAA